MKCEDCIHDGVCLSQISYFMGCDEYTGEEVTDIEKKCSDFKNKADYAEVKHGYWKEYFSAGKFHYDCSVCDDGFATKERLKTVPKYCSNCGAIMDGGGNKE